MVESEGLSKRVGVAWRRVAAVVFGISVCEDVKLTRVRKSGEEVEGGGAYATEVGGELGGACH